jgi:hypothetical protein
MAASMETRFKELEAKVRELTDREALRDLRYRYHECRFLMLWLRSKARSRPKISFCANNSRSTRNEESSPAGPPD